MAIKIKRPVLKKAKEPSMKNYELIEVSRVRKAGWNYKKEDKKRAKQLAHILSRSGQVVNINVREIKDGGVEVFDGNHRIDAAILLGWTHIVAYNHGRLKLAEAQRLAIELNESGFAPDPKKLDEVIDNLKKRYKITDLKLTMPVGTLVQETRFSDDYNPEELPEPEIEGEDSRNGRFIITFADEEQRAFLRDLLCVPGTRIVYTCDSVVEGLEQQAILAEVEDDGDPDYFADIMGSPF